MPFIKVEPPPGIGTIRYGERVPETSGGVPRMLEYDLKTGKPMWEINIPEGTVTEIPELPRPTGLVRKTKE